MMEIKGTFPLPPFFFQEIQAHGSLGDYLGNMKPGVTAGCCWTWCEMAKYHGIPMSVTLDLAGLESYRTSGDTLAARLALKRG